MHTAFFNSPYLSPTRGAFKLPKHPKINNISSVIEAYAVVMGYGIHTSYTPYCNDYLID